MSERKKNGPSIDFESVIEQITRPNRHGKLLEIEKSRQYVFHVRGNSTKSLPDTIKWLYEEIDNLGGYVTDGVSDEDVEIIQKLFTRLTGKKIIKPDDQNLFTNMLNKIIYQKENGKIAENHGICFVLAAENQQSFPPFLVIVVPKRV